MWKIYEHKQVEKQLKSCPIEVQKKYEKWKDIVAISEPQTNGMVERFNGRISELLKQTRFNSAEELEKGLLAYLLIYNEHIPQRALNHQTPLQAIQNGRLKSHIYLLHRYVIRRDLTRIQPMVLIFKVQIKYQFY